MNGTKSVHYKRKFKLAYVKSLVVTAIIAIFCLTPFYWILITSLKPAGTEFNLPIEYWPSKPTLQAYRAILWETFNFLRPLRNGFVVSTLVAILSLLISSLSGYAIARLRFRYKIRSLLLIQIGGMVPGIVTLAPTFMLLKKLSLLRTLWAIILPHIAYNVPLGTWLLASYFVTLPFELEDAAKIDGYTPPQIFWRVIMPLSAPGLFSAGIFAFLGSWGDFMLASCVTMGDMRLQTVPAAILGFSLNFRYQWTWISAAIILSLIPTIAIVIIFQRWVIKGLAAGAVKY